MQIVMGFTVFICGAGIMCLEMLGFRMLPPYFGSSIYVTGSLISVFLLALSLGYYLGGRIADKKPSPRILGSIILLSGLIILSLAYYFRPLCQMIASWGWHTRWGSLLASTLLFVLPAILLGMVSPFAIKLSTLALGDVGKTAGNLYAISTVGSVVGTLATSFYLIALFHLHLIIIGLGTILVFLGLLLLPFRSKILLIFLLLSPLAKAWYLVDLNTFRVIETKESLYHYILIGEDKDWRVMQFNRTIQSGVSKKDNITSIAPYTDGFHLGLVFNPEAKDVLFIGCGGATGPRQFRKFYPNLQIDIVELDPEVVRMAKKYFNLKEDEKLKVYVEDGRVYLNRSRKKYDIIILDAYFAEAIPFHLTTKEFMEIVKKHLNAKGVVICNVIGSVSGGKSRYPRSQYKTLKRVFNTVYFFPVVFPFEKPNSYDKETSRNIILVATNEKKIGKMEIVEKAKRLQQEKIPYLVSIASSLLTYDVKITDVPVLLDDYAPVDDLIKLAID
ncbi:MAG: spermidine synthase [bacterium]